MTTVDESAPSAAGSGSVSDAIARHPVGAVWVGVCFFSLGPVLVAGASIAGVGFSFWRLWCGVVVMGVAEALRRRGGGLVPGRKGWAWALGCGVLFAGHQLMFMSALKLTSVVDVTLMNTIAPIAVGVLAVPAFDERPGWAFRAWSIVAMIGAAGVVIAGSTGPMGDPAGMLLAAGNVVLYALFFVGSKLALPHTETVPFLFGTMAAAAATVSAFVGLTGTAITPVGASDLARCVAVAVVSGAGGHFAMTSALRHVPVNLPPVVMLSIPVISGTLAWLTLGQEIRGVQVLAGVVTLVAVAGAVRSPTAAALQASEALALSEET